MNIEDEEMLSDETLIKNESKNDQSSEDSNVQQIKPNQESQIKPLQAITQDCINKTAHNPIKIEGRVCEPCVFSKQTTTVLHLRDI